MYFLGCGIWGCPPEFTCLRVAVSKSAEIEMTHSKNLFSKFWHLYRTAFLRIATVTRYNARVTKSQCGYKLGAVTFYFAILERARDPNELPFIERQTIAVTIYIYVSIVTCTLFALILFLSVILDDCNRSKNLQETCSASSFVDESHVRHSSWLLASVEVCRKPVSAVRL